jgi:SAM-dependent methyltransferase
MHKGLLQQSNALYDKVALTEQTPQSRACWTDIYRQYHRFAEILKSINDTNGSLLDLGCGNGELLRFLNFMGFTGRYTGVDINLHLLDEARRRYPDHTFLEADIFKDEVAPHDFVVMSGLFNLNFGQDWQFIKDFIERMYTLCNHCVIFNAISTHVNFKDESMFYINPADLADHILRNISSRMELRHGFVPYNFTITIHKGPSWHSLKEI